MCIDLYTHHNLIRDVVYIQKSKTENPHQMKRFSLNRTEAKREAESNAI